MTRSPHMPVPTESKRDMIVAHGTRLPPPRPGVRHVRVWLLGIVIADDRLRRRVNRFFHWPMIVLGLTILPLLAIEFLIEFERFSLLWWMSAISLAIIWTAFTVEFLIKIAIAECRIEYVKHNWLDLIIIALPALRPLRVATLAKTSRVFTLRGVGMKILRYAFTIIIGLEATDRMLERIGWKVRRDRPDPSRMTRHQLMQEVKRLRKISDAWEAWYEAHVEYECERNRTVPERPLLPADEGDDCDEPLSASQAPAGA